MLLNDLFTFFRKASEVGAIKDTAIADLYKSVSIRTQPAAQAIANIAIASKDPSNKTNLLNDLLNKIKQPGNEVAACLTLGELGKLMDMSKVPNII